MSDLESGDLVCRSRRERLSAAEEQRLSRLLESSDEARFHAAVLDEIEPESCVHPGDDALVQRLASRALRPARSPARRRLSSRALQVAAVLLLVGVVSGALATSGVLGSGISPAPPSNTVTVRAPDEASPRGGARARSRPEAAAPDSEISRAAEAPPVTANPPRSAPLPAELLARANLARREGRSAEARGLYRSLVAAYPKAREAPLAHLALAKLLETTEPALAFTHYGAAAAGSGGLRAEGLWGQAECARKLRRPSAESRALDALVRDFPASPYAEAARGRMRDELR